MRWVWGSGGVLCVRSPHIRCGQAYCGTNPNRDSLGGGSDAGLAREPAVVGGVLDFVCCFDGAGADAVLVRALGEHHGTSLHAAWCSNDPAEAQQRLCGTGCCVGATLGVACSAAGSSHGGRTNGGHGNLRRCADALASVFGRPNSWFTGVGVDLFDRGVGGVESYCVGGNDVTVGVWPWCGGSCGCRRVVAATRSTHTWRGRALVADGAG